MSACYLQSLAAYFLSGTFMFMQFFRSVPVLSYISVIDYVCIIHIVDMLTDTGLTRQLLMLMLMMVMVILLYI